MNLSVLMAVYAKEKAEFFDLSLESVLVKQTRLPDEFVLICDGELTPELEAVVAKYEAAFSGIFKVYRKEQEGLGPALNFGIPLCSYSLIARADSDDICVPERFEKELAFMEAHPDVSVVGSYISEFDSYPANSLWVKTLPTDHEALFEWAKFRNPLNHMTVVMRKEDVLRAGSYVKFQSLEDYYLWVRMLVDGCRIANIGEVLVHARVGNGMFERRGDKMYIHNYRIMNKFMKSHGMIGLTTYLRNMLAAYAFIYLPAGLKKFVYGTLLRRK